MDTQYKFSFNISGNFNQDNFTGTKFDVPNCSFYASYYNWDILTLEVYGELGKTVVYELYDKYYFCLYKRQDQ